MRLLVLLVLAIAATCAAAQPYVMGGATSSSVKTNVDVSGSGFGLTLGGGYRFAKHFAVEAAYQVFDDSSSVDQVPSGTAVTSTFKTYKLRGLGLFGLAAYPVTESVSVLARGGVYRLRSELRTTTQQGLTTAPFTTTTLADTTTNETVNVPAIGLGAEYLAADRWRLRAMFEHVSGKGMLDRVSTISVSALFSF